MIYAYNRNNAVKYAEKWAYQRNPLFFDFSDIGGNCTNFVSQCLLAGCCTMNFTATFGWYYLSVEDRSPSWTGVEFLFNFLVENVGDGPFGVPEEVQYLQYGDIIQLSDENGDFYHTLLVSGFNENGPLVAAQTNDTFNRPISEYNYVTSRGIHILGYRRSSPRCNCFDELFSGSSIIDCL